MSPKMQTAKTKQKQTTSKMISSTREGFHAKDGQIYSSYDEMRTANIRYNELILSKKGLDADSFRKIVASTKPIRRSPHQQRKQQVAATTEPRRSSRRIRKESPSSHPKLTDDDDDESSYVKNSPNKRKKLHRRHTIQQLSEKERSKLRNQMDWLDHLDTYLDTVQSLSRQNRRSVMRQVEKLAAGWGITYHHWPEGTYFYQGQAIGLDHDFVRLFDEAYAFENEHGKDLGNGWLLRHPIKKLQEFQAFKTESSS